LRDCAQCPEFGDIRRKKASKGAYCPIFGDIRRIACLWEEVDSMFPG